LCGKENQIFSFKKFILLPLGLFSQEDASTLAPHAIPATPLITHKLAPMTHISLIISNTKVQTCGQTEAGQRWAVRLEFQQQG